MKKMGRAIMKKSPGKPGFPATAILSDYSQPPAHPARTARRPRTPRPAAPRRHAIRGANGACARSYPYPSPASLYSVNRPSAPPYTYSVSGWAHIASSAHLPSVPIGTLEPARTNIGILLSGAFTRNHYPPHSACCPEVAIPVAALGQVHVAHSHAVLGGRQHRTYHERAPEHELIGNIARNRIRAEVECQHTISVERSKRTAAISE